MTHCPCRPAPDQRCPSKMADSCSCSLPAGHGGNHVKCVHTPCSTKHRAYEWADRTEEATDAAA